MIFFKKSFILFALFLISTNSSQINLSDHEQIELQSFFFAAFKRAHATLYFIKNIIPIVEKYNQMLVDTSIRFRNPSKNLSYEPEKIEDLSKEICAIHKIYDLYVDQLNVVTKLGENNPQIKDYIEGYKQQAQKEILKNGIYTACSKLFKEYQSNNIYDIEERSLLSHISSYINPYSAYIKIDRYLNGALKFHINNLKILHKILKQMWIEIETVRMDIYKKAYESFVDIKNTGKIVSEIKELCTCMEKPI